MMFDRIFIPTVHRPEKQITYEMLPQKYKDITTLVVQSWERPEYNYNCQYAVLPDIKEYHYSDYYCLPKTRKFIYELGKDLRYCIFDDDLQFGRRNSKYFSDISNMEKSKRICTENDITEMFELFDDWLNIDTVTVCGCSQVENPPLGDSFVENSSITSAFWIDGPKFKNILHSLDITSVRVGEDVCFLLSLLKNGLRNRVSGEFCQFNYSNFKKMKSTVWGQQTFEQTLNDHKYLERMFPGIFEILYDESGKRLHGGYKNFGKSRIRWKKAFIDKSINTLEKFI